MVLTLCLIMIGAWVRLTDAGLGCPDWPGCYGQLTPTQAASEIARAVDAQGGEHGPVSMAKAWREMGHRYIAMGLGLLIIAIAVLGWRWRAQLARGPVLGAVLLFVVILQGLFGKWTVTLLLKPAIVTGHLIGGILLLSLLVWLWQRQKVADIARPTDDQVFALRRLGVPAVIAVIALSAQIVLGGWTSTNYAALACTDIPTCQGSWWPATDFANAFSIFRELGMDSTGKPLDSAALTAIHLTHRIGAILASAVLLWLAVGALRRPLTRQPAQWLIAALIGQITLGISNVVFSLPLAVAVAHNGLAAVLMMILVVINYRVFRAHSAGSYARHAP